MTKLYIADNFTLPIDAVTQTFAILAKRGVGKTYTASVMAEEMLKAGQQIVAVDPTGAWWGLRSEFPVVILGGEHADVPLEEHAGEIVARAIAENRFSAVLDLSLFRKGQMIRFMTTFGETLYRLNREPLHLFVDEADAFAPQGRSGYGVDENRMLGAMEDIVRRGRKRGIGCTLITQRPAVLNKNVLTQAECLIAMRLVHPKDIDAVMEWVNVHAEPQSAEKMTERLPALGIGEAWFWSPGWLEIFKTVHVRKRESFDSSATPKPGEGQRRPKRMQTIDMETLGEQIKATVEKTKADDPKELRRRIADLERQLRERPAHTQKVEVEKIVEVPVLKNGQLQRTESLLERTETLVEKLTSESAALRSTISPAFTKPAAAIASPKVITTRSLPRTATLKQRESLSVIGATGALPRGEAAVLRAVIQYPDGLRREQLTVLTGYKRSSRDAYIQRLRERSYVAQIGDLIVVTPVGIDALPDAEPLPTGMELQSYWLARLPLGERAILESLIEAYPNPIARDLLSEQTGYKRSSRDAYLQRLAAKQLVEDVGRGEVRASDMLFEK